MSRPFPFAAARAFCSLLMVGVLGALASPASAQTSTISAGPASNCLTSTQTCATVPVTISRTDASPMLAFSVTFTLSSELALCTPGPSILEGDYLSGFNPSTSFQVRDRGGNTWTADGTILGAANCGPTAASGTLFTIRVTNTVGSGTGTITVTSVTLRNCSNGSLSSTIGSAGSVTIDPAPVTVAAIADPTVAEQSLLTVTPSAILTSCVTGPVTWTVLGLPSGASFTPSTGVVTWTPGCHAFEDGPTYGPVTLTAHVGTGETGSASFTIHVTNTPGTVAVDPITDPQVVAEGSLLTVTPNAVLAGCAETPVSWTVLGLPAGASFDNSTGVVTWTPDCAAYENGPDYGPVTVTAHAATGEFGSRSYSIHVNNTPIAISAVTALAGSQVLTGNGPGTTTGITVSFTPPSGATSIEVYRAPFGNYPEYDDAPGAGSVPAAPSYPPGGAWTLTGVTASGQVDHPATRDFWYYVAFAKNACGDVSPASAMTAGTLNYHLGDFDGGDNQVTGLDISDLGGHYGLSGGAMAPFAYLDVGPTTTGYVDGRPTTDDEIEFEDLVICAINYGSVSAPQAKAAPASQIAGDELRVESPEHVVAGATMVAKLVLKGAGDLRALSTQLAWDPAVVEPTEITEGAWLQNQGGVALSARPGNVDAAVRGAMTGEGELASVTFRVLSAGNPAVRIAKTDGRSATNQRIAVNAWKPAAPTVTALAPAAPNPFRSNVALDISLARGGAVELSIYTVDGRRVRTLVRETREPGAYHLTWDGRDDAGSALHAGIYYVRFRAPGAHATRAITYLK